MKAEKELGIEIDQQGRIGKKREDEGERKARGRPTKAEELAKQRGRADSLGSVKDLILKRKKKELEEEAARAAEKEILDKFNEMRRTNRSPPAKIKKGEEDKVKEKGSTGQKEGMEFTAKVTVEREMLEKMIRDQAKETLRKLKEEIKDQREEIESLKRKIRKLEMGAGKRKRDESAENRSRQDEMKWWSDDDERNDERRRKNIIIRIERNRWMGKGTNWEKVRQLLSEELKLKVERKEVSVIGLRGEWLTMLVRLGSEEEKWRLLEARRRAASRLKVKMDEDKSVERRIREGEEKKRRKERRGEDDGRTKGSEEDEIASELEKSLLMETEEEKEKTKAE
ncbi:vicilin-like seed storage protein At2g18540 [Temnothorax curvispinosus]|uniref:Vicilin-like seed storage protein At2g18540 n=1 Tax=Temnothorax curvispinosus TaxID=300111 RepID=A0A6J1PPP4_9HYME|nr:vicilin-like seed storage protein At2g18540 [Temnothorax curvispinosus]